MGKFELIFGAFSAIIIILFMLAIVFAISYFSIKFFEKRTNQIWLLNTQAPQMSVFTRLFLKLNYLVYYLYVATILLIFSCGFWSRSGKTYDWSLMDNVLGKIIEPIRETLLSIFPYGDSEFVFFVLFCSGVALLPFFIRMLYYYKKTGFKFLRIYIIVAFMYYALCNFLIYSTLFTLAYENFNPQKLEQLKEAFSAFF